MNAQHHNSQRYRTIWLSDIHLGTPGCKAEFLVDFLKLLNNREQFKNINIVCEML